MRIATWNLNKPSKPRADRQIALMRSKKADIWVLTETNERVLLGDGYRQLANSQLDKTLRVGESWVSIWSRWEGKVIEVKGDATRTACAIISPPGRKKIVVYGTVLPWGGSSWMDKRSAGGEAFCAALAAQRAEWQQFSTKHKECDFCLAGDFNQDLNQIHYAGSKLGQSKLREALDSVGLSCVTGGADDPVLAKVHEPRANIDHICFNSDLAGKCRLPADVWFNDGKEPPRLSDHFGILVECK